MSFSGSAKAEACRSPLSRPCCAAAEAYGALLYANTFSAREIKIITGCESFAQRLPKLFRKAFGIEFDAVPPQNNQGKYIFLFSSPEKIAAVFEKYGYEAKNTLVHHINLGVLEEDCCKAAFMRGAFLAGGSVTDPEKRCHLELVTDHMNVSRETFSILLEMGFTPRDTVRAGHYVTYFKQSAQIEDFFTTIGAKMAAMDIMNAKVEKDMRNEINRKVNCDSANADKIVLAAQEQLEAIKKLDREQGLDELPDKLRETALLRIANPEASLAELAMLALPPVTKSCISHRIKKLVDMSQNR